jgi:hypothetical protein
MSVDTVDTVEQIARAVLYEGYLLWPYRRSAAKNRQRWTFGGLYPPGYHRHRDDGDASSLELQCLVDGPADARLDVTVRFLHVLDRRPLRRGVAGHEPVDELVANGERHLAWQEASEREIAVGGGQLGELASPARRDVSIPGEVASEPLRDADGTPVGALRRTWEPLAATAETAAEPLRTGLHRVTVRVTNTSDWQGEDRGEAAKRALCSTHVVVRAHGAAFVSLTDPPAEFHDAAQDCDNLGVWPVLVGDPGDRHTILASPIILSDHPRVAPESPGDLFDGCEIDELLVHSIRSLTDEERREMRDTDPRVREILERTQALTPEELMRLHGAVRELRPWGERP